MLRIALIQLAHEKPELRKLLAPLFRVAAEPDDKWTQFLAERYEGGKKKVRNPNYRTRKKYPEVALSTAIKSHSEWLRIRQEFEAWLKKSRNKPPVEAEFLDTYPETLKNFGSQFKTQHITEDQIEALKGYSGYDNSPINYHYRQNTIKTGLYGKLWKTVKDLNDVFAHPDSRVPESVKTVRVVANDAPFAKKAREGVLKPGMIIQDKGYMSTSLRSDFNFAYLEPGRNSYRMEISVPKGAKGIYLGPQNNGTTFSHNPREYELLLNRSTKLRILEITDTTIKAEVVS